MFRAIQDFKIKLKSDREDVLDAFNGQFREFLHLLSRMELCTSQIIGLNKMKRSQLIPMVFPVLESFTSHHTVHIALSDKSILALTA